MSVERFYYTASCMAVVLSACALETHGSRVTNLDATSSQADAGEATCAADDGRCPAGHVCVTLQPAAGASPELSHVMAEVYDGLPPALGGLEVPRTLRRLAAQAVQGTLPLEVRLDLGLESGVPLPGAHHVVLYGLSLDPECDGPGAGPCALRPTPGRDYFVATLKQVRLDEPCATVVMGERVLAPLARLDEDDSPTTGPTLVYSCPFDAPEGPRCREYALHSSREEARSDCLALAGRLTAASCQTPSVGYCQNPSGRDYFYDVGCDDIEKACSAMDGEATHCAKPADRNLESTPGNDRAGVVACGEGTPRCDVAGDQACCVSEFSGDGAQCRDTGDCGDAESVECDGPEDCPSAQVCCVRVDLRFLGLASRAEVGCVPQDSCVYEWSPSAGGRLEFQSCHADSDCPAGQTCSRNDTFSWWGFCQ